MKKIFKKIVDTFKNFFRWVWKECRDWRTFALLVIVCLVMGLPVWGGYLLAFLFGWEWAFVVASAVFAFWWIPGMPFFALSVSVTLGIKKIWEAMVLRKQKREGEAPETQADITLENEEDKNM